MGQSKQKRDALKARMADALIDLMDDYPFSRISPNDIVRTAEVGRMSWFHNFKSKEEAVIFKLSYAWEQYAEQHIVAETSRFNPKNALAFFEFNLSIKQTLRILYRSGQEHLLFDTFRHVMLEPVISRPSLWYQEHFFAFGLYGILDGWIRRDFAESPKELEQEVLQLFPVKPKTVYFS